jgi:hypothetical protein
VLGVARLTVAPLSQAGRVAGAAVPMLELRAALRTDEEGVLRDRFEEFD